MKDPARIAALIVQNGDIYEDALGPKYKALNRIGAKPTAEEYNKLRAGITREHCRAEF
jgi:hypothetical protein